MKKEIKNLEIINLFNNGKSIKEISEIYNCNQETIRLRLKKEGVDTGKKKCNILCLHCSGNTRKEGKTNGMQRYLCLDCGKISTEKSLEHLKNVENYHNKIKKMYLNDNLSTTEIAKILNISSTVPQRILKKYGITRDLVTSQNLKIANKLNLNYDEYIKKLPAFKKYKLNVIRLTKKQPINNLPNYNKRGRCGVDGAFQLDHKHSILEGFKNGVEPEIIANINNLEFIPWEENLNKSSKSSITLIELLKLINKIN